MPDRNYVYLCLRRWCIKYFIQSKFLKPGFKNYDEKLSLYEQVLVE